MAVTTISADFLAGSAKRRALQEQLLQEEHTAIIKQLSAEALASCPTEFLCPISLEIMHFPVMLMATGQRYDLSSILAWLQAGGTTCPLTGLQLTKKVELRLSESLRARISQWLAEQGVDLEHTMKEVAKKWHAKNSDGDTIVNQKERRKQVRRRFLAGIIAVFQFLGGESKIYGSIY